jgi:hypothetical protein
MRWIIGTLTALLIGSVLAQTSMSATGQGRTLRLKAGTVWHSYILSKKRVDVDMDRARVLDFQHKAGFRYILLEVGGVSNRNFPMSQCGAGTESSLVWLRFKKWHLLEIRAVKYESCWLTIEPENRLRQGTLLTIAFSDFHVNKNKTLTYNYTHPERGLSLSGQLMLALK